MRSDPRKYVSSRAGTAERGVENCAVPFLPKGALMLTVKAAKTAQSSRKKSQATTRTQRIHRVVLALPSDPLCALWRRFFAGAVPLVLFDDEVIGHAGDVVADYAREGFLTGLLVVVGRQS